VVWAGPGAAGIAEPLVLLVAAPFSTFSSCTMALAIWDDGSGLGDELSGTLVSSLPSGTGFGAVVAVCAGDSESRDDAGC
jgi:hypothetical protein